jgi:prepilin-type N-terminal cleavage/methylation domain-containing protein
MRLEHRRSRQAGFSLIELLTVVAIIVILAAVSYPTLAEYVRHYRVRGGAEEVITVLQRARSQAIMKNVNYGVLFVVLSPTTYQYMIEDVQLSGAALTPLGIYKNTRVPPAPTPTDVNYRRAQFGPVHRLPAGIEFAPAGCVGVAGTPSDVVRFSKLGMACRPLVSSAACPPPSGAAGGTAALLFDASGAFRVCIHDNVRRLSRLITVSNGGGRMVSATAKAAP